jgi:hypothetical protein
MSASCALRSGGGVLRCENSGSWTAKPFSCLANFNMSKKLEVSHRNHFRVVLLKRASNMRRCTL